MLKTSHFPPNMAAHGERLYPRLAFPSTQGRELTCRAAQFFSFAPQKLAQQAKEARHIILFLPSRMCSLCYEIQFTSHLHWKTGEEEKDFGAEETKGFGAMQSSEPWL